MGRSTSCTLSALTTAGMIYGVWENRNRMLGKDVFAILGTFFLPSSQSDVEKGFLIASRRFRYSAFPKRNIRGGTENMSTQEDESQCVAAQGLLWLHITLPHLCVFCKSKLGPDWICWISPTCVLPCPGAIFFSRLPENSGRWNKSWASRLNLSGPQHEDYSRHLQFLG